MYVKVLRKYKKLKTKELRDKTFYKAMPKLHIIVNSLIRKTRTYKIKNDLTQECYLLFLYYLEKVNINNRNDFQIKAYIECSVRRDLRKKIKDFLPKNKDETYLSENLIDKNYDIYKIIFKKDIKRIIDKLHIKPLHKKIFLDYLENPGKRKELRKKYSKNKNQLDYIIRNTIKSLQKYTKDIKN
jgi:hypothetical protein